MYFTFYVSELGKQVYFFSRPTKPDLKFKLRRIKILILHLRFPLSCFFLMSDQVRYSPAKGWKVQHCSYIAQFTFPRLKSQKKSLIQIFSINIVNPHSKEIIKQWLLQRSHLSQSWCSTHFMKFHNSRGT